MTERANRTRRTGSIHRGRSKICRQATFKGTRICGRRAGRCGTRPFVGFYHPSLGWRQTSKAIAEAVHWRNAFAQRPRTAVLIQRGVNCWMRTPAGATRSAGLGCSLPGDWAGPCRAEHWRRQYSHSVAPAQKANVVHARRLLQAQPLSSGYALAWLDAAPEELHCCPAVSASFRFQTK